MNIFFNNQLIKAHEGDSVASALYRSGRRIFSRSFKYHRPRGVLCLSGKCPNCLMNIDGVPNVRACMTPVRDGMQVKPQNAHPSLEHDWLSIADKFSWLMPVGFYYKTFTQPKVWRFVEPFIRKAAGLGEIQNPKSQIQNEYEHKYEHLYLHTDIAIIGGGAAEVMAAIEKAEKAEPSLRLTLIDDQPELGGYMRYQKANVNVEILKNAFCFGIYEGNLLGIVQKNPKSSFMLSERLIHLRAKQIVVATGAYEIPILFKNNDLPGVMLSSAVQKLMNLHGIKPAENAVVVSQEPDGGQVAKELQSAGVKIVAVVPPHAVVAAMGKKHVSGIQTSDRHISCELIVVCGNWILDAALTAQAGGKLEWDEEAKAFIPKRLPPHTSYIATSTPTPYLVYPDLPLPGRKGYLKKSFVCFCEDVSVKDLCDAIDEGFDHIETLKRYTTATMGPCQGKMCQLASIAICAKQTHKTIGETGTTTARPPTFPISLGALAGARHHPTKRTPMHYKHDELNCVWMDMGEWKRPHYYKDVDYTDYVLSEYRAVRERVGIIDLSTLGKLDVKGRDASKLLDKVYTNRISDLRLGRSRYSIVCDDSGVILDDGTISRLSEEHFFITTTTGNIEFMQQWLEWWSAGSGWCVHITNVTGGLAAVNVAGPKAKEVLKKLTHCDLSAKAFPYMACRQTEVGGIPCLMLRIGFVGESGWEIHFPAEYGEYLWALIIESGKEAGIQPFGVEAQRLLRLEKKHIIVGVDTDATSNPIESDIAWVVKLDKEDFIGKAAIERIQARQRREKLVGFVMQDDLVPEDGAAIVLNGKPVGRITSVRFSPVNNKAVGMAWMPAELAENGREIQVHVSGSEQIAKAKIVPEAFYDPEGQRLRM